MISILISYGIPFLILTLLILFIPKSKFFSKNWIENSPKNWQLLSIVIFFIILVAYPIVTYQRNVDVAIPSTINQPIVIEQSEVEVIEVEVKPTNEEIIWKSREENQSSKDIFKDL